MNVYLDNAATTQVDKRVLKAMERYFLKDYGNPSSLHSFGTKAKEALTKVRKQVAKKIGALPEEIIFTSGGTEANNLAIKGILEQSKKKHIITSAIEHASVLQTCKTLEKKGYKVTYLPVDSKGNINPKDLIKAITKKTALVSLMHANNEVGTIQPIQTFGKICKKYNVPLHTDAVQSFMKIPIHVQKMHIDALSLSAHKIHGPKGVGVLYVNKELLLNPKIIGGKQEFNLRAGTQNIPGIVGLGKALEIYKGCNPKLRDYMLKKILTLKGAQINGSLKHRLPHIIHVSFENLEGEMLLLHLNALGVYVSTGSACNEREIKASHVLQAMGLSKKNGSLRITLSKYTTKKEIDYALRKLTIVVESLRRLQP